MTVPVATIREQIEAAQGAIAAAHRLRDAAMLAMYRGGATMREIASEFGLSHQRVGQIVNAA